MTTDRITIDSITGPDEGKGLMNCYFKPKHDGEYSFHDKDDRVKARDLSVGSSFSFDLDEYPGITWRLTVATASDIRVTGTWTADKGVPEQEDGGYQAQAGGGLDVESSASAYA